MKTTLIALMAGGTFFGCGGDDADDSDEPPQAREAELVVQYEGNPSFRTNAKLYVKVIAPNDAIAGGGKVDDLSTDERILVLRDPELIGYYVAASQTPDVAFEAPQCGRMINLKAGDTATVTVSIPRLSSRVTCRVTPES